MIISGGSRSNFKFFAGHLMNAQDNERVEVAEIRGLVATDVREGLREMDAIARCGTRAKNTFYHADLNTRADEHLTPEQWEFAVNTLERNLHLEGHARIVIEHTKEGRTHRHVCWSRVDPETMTVTADSHNFRAHEQTSRELEAAFGHSPVAGSITRDGDEKRPDRRPENWEVFRGKRSKISPDDVKQEVTALWNASDSGAAFAAALEAQGYVLCQGDKRDFVLLDAAGDSHSLARRIDGAKAAAVRVRMADIDRDALPSVSEARVWLKGHPREQEDLENTAAAQERREEPRTSNAREQLDEYMADAVARLSDDDAPAWSVEEVTAKAPGAARSSRSARARLDDYMAPIEAALKRGEDMPVNDGRGWMERVRVMVTETVEIVTDWAREKWTSFVEMVQDRRSDMRDSPEPDEPG